MFNNDYVSDAVTVDLVYFVLLEFCISGQLNLYPFDFVSFESVDKRFRIPI